MLKKIAFYTAFLLPLILSSSKADVIYLTNDTMKVGGGYYANDLIQVDPGDRRVPVTAYLRNTFDAAGFTLRLVYDSTIMYPYYPTVPESSFYQPIRSSNLPVFGGTFSTLGEIYFVGSPFFNPNTEFIIAGRGPIVEFYFNIRASAPQGYYLIKLEEDTLNQPQYDNTLGDKLGQHIYIPVLANGAIVVGNCTPPGNHSPVVSPVDPKFVKVDDILSFRVSASDADTDQLALWAQDLPPNSTFPQVQGTGSVMGMFSFNPSSQQVLDTFMVAFIAGDEHCTTDTEWAQIAVIDAGNHKPILSHIPDTAAAASGSERKDTLTLSIKAIDPEGTIPHLYAQDSPPNAIFTDLANGSGKFVFVPDFSQVGLVYSVMFIASDDSLSDSLSTFIKVISSKSGDVDGNGMITVSDLVYEVNFMFRGGPPPYVLKSGDANCDGGITISDVVYLVNYLFKGGPKPAC